MIWINLALVLAAFVIVVLADVYPPVFKRWLSRLSWMHELWVIVLSYLFSTMILLMAVYNAYLGSVRIRELCDLTAKGVR